VRPRIQALADRLTGRRLHIVCRSITTASPGNRTERLLSAPEWVLFVAILVIRTYCPAMAQQRPEQSPQQGPEQSPQRGPQHGLWLDRTLVALGGLPRAASDTALLQEVALQFADQFGPGDRVYEGDRPAWHCAVLDALDQLLDDGLVVRRRGLRLTDAGVASLVDARGRVGEERLTLTPSVEELQEQPSPMASAMPVPGVISPALRTAAGRASAGVDAEELPVIVELNLRYARGPSAAFRRLDQLWRRVNVHGTPARLAHDYARGTLTMNEIKRLVAADAAPLVWPERSILRIWPDFQVRSLIDVTVSTDRSTPAVTASSGRSSTRESTGRTHTSPGTTRSATRR